MPPCRARELAKVIYSRNTCHTRTEHVLLTQQVSNMAFVWLGFNTQSSTARTVLEFGLIAIVFRLLESDGDTGLAGESGGVPRGRAVGRPHSAAGAGAPFLLFLGASLTCKSGGDR